MENIALYRKYRPKTFSEVVGQESITESLRAQVASGRVSHAYLFTGTRGTGKTTCAKILARAICCQNPHEGEPCNECEACRSILSGSATDIVEIDAASNNGVDNIREIRQEVIYTPAELKYRVYIIDEVHNLSPGAFNALLKTLEEPPAYVVFILATTELHKVPATILSRCQRFDFRRIPAEIIAPALADIAAREGFTLDSDAADTLAAMGDGSMRDAVSLLDRVRSASDRITQQTVTDTLGLPTEKEILSIFDGVLRQDPARALSAFTRAYMSGRDIISIYDNLLSLLRDIYLYKATGEQDLLLSRWRRQAIELSSLCSMAQLEKWIDDMQFFFTRSTRTSARRLDAEMTLVKMTLPLRENPNTEENFHGRENVGDNSENNSFFSNLSSDDSPPSAAAQATENSIRPSETTDAVKTFPEDFLPAVRGKVSPGVYSHLKKASVKDDGGTLRLGVSDIGLTLIKSPDVMDILRSEGRKLGFTDVAVAVEETEDPLIELERRARNLGIKVTDSRLNREKD